nr:hypothetical protein [Tanacetum cinerariifolium]
DINAYEKMPKPVIIVVSSTWATKRYEDFINPVPEFEIERQPYNTQLEEQMRNRHMIQSLLNVNPQHYEQIKFMTEATLLQIIAPNGWYYRKCSQCNIKIPEDSAFPQCRNYGPQPTPHYGNCFRDIIDDGTATTTITCFSLDAHTFVPDYNSVVNSVEDKDAYHVPSILSQAEGHRYIFQYHFSKKAKPGRPNFTLNDVLKLSTQPLLALPEPESTNSHPAKILEESSTSIDPPSTIKGRLPTATAKDNVGIDSKGFLEFFDCLGSRQGVEDLREGAQGDHEAKVFQVSNDDTAVAQRRLEDKKRKEKTNMDCLIKEQEKEYQTGWKIKTGTGSMQVLQGVEFKVEPQKDHTFELARDREQHLAYELFGYREDINEVAFVVAAVENIYAHESLTFNNIVACEVISKWKAGLKDYMDARSYALCWRDTPYCSLEGSLSGDCDVEKNGKWSCIYAVGSQEYQIVCTILNIASVDVGILDKFDHGLQTDIQYMEALPTTEAGYMTFTEAWKKKMWLKGLLTESRYELRLVAGIATGALVKGSSRFEVPTQVKVIAYRY